MESLGQDEVKQQVQPARLDVEGKEEEEGAGDEFRLGDWCRAEWSQDGVVYEAIIESLDRKTGTAKVKFLGFGNVEEKSLDELFVSKGEEWRLEKENMGEEVCFQYLKFKYLYFVILVVSNELINDLIQFQVII
jgi:hypothetical protein